MCSHSITDRSSWLDADRHQLRIEQHRSSGEVGAARPFSSPRVFGIGAGPCQGSGREFEPRLPLQPPLRPPVVVVTQRQEEPHGWTARRYTGVGPAFHYVPSTRKVDDCPWRKPAPNATISLKPGSDSRVDRCAARGDHASSRVGASRARHCSGSRPAMNVRYMCCRTLSGLIVNLVNGGGRSRRPHVARAAREHPHQMLLLRDAQRDHEHPRAARLDTTRFQLRHYPDYRWL